LTVLDTFSKNTEISHFIKIRPVAQKLFNADRRTERHDETKSLFAILHKNIGLGIAKYVLAGTVVPSEGFLYANRQGGS
jgi:hypothetical protein